MKSALIVEDLPDAQAWLTDIVERAFPATIVTAVATVAAARSACERAKCHGGFDLALIDLQLPDGSGVELLRAIGEDTPHTDCVVATIYDDDAHLFPALKAGARGYLLKENDKEQLIEALQGILAGKPPLSPKIARRVLQHFHELHDTAEAQLTAREVEVLMLIAKGLRVRELAGMIGISPHTANDHLKAIYRKLNVSSRAEAAVEAVRRGLI